jgi:hypothetical protein
MEISLIRQQIRHDAVMKIKEVNSKANARIFDDFSQLHLNTPTHSAAVEIYTVTNAEVRAIEDRLSHEIRDVADQIGVDLSELTAQIAECQNIDDVWSIITKVIDFYWSPLAPCYRADHTIIWRSVHSAIEKIDPTERPQHAAMARALRKIYKVFWEPSEPAP